MERYHKYFIEEIPGLIKDQNGDEQHIVTLLGYDGASVDLSAYNDGRITPKFGVINDDGTLYDAADVVRNVATLEKACAAKTATAADATIGVAITDAVAGTPIKVKAESVHTQANAGTQTFASPKAITGNASVTVTNTNGVTTNTYVVEPTATIYGLSTATDHIQLDTGVLTRQTKMITLNGTSSDGTWSGTNPYVLTFTDKAAGTSNFACSHSVPADSGTTAETCVGHAVNKTITFYPNTGAAYNTLTKWKALLLAASTTASPVQLLYEISDTTESVPKRYVNALTGTNTITHNAEGAITAVYYRDVNDDMAILDALNVMTARGDIIYRGASAPARLAKGTANYVLTIGANDPAWGTVPGASTSAAGLAPQATAPAAGLRNVVAIDNTETAYTNKALFDATDPSTQTYSDAAAVGTAMAAARRDHKHAMPAFGGTAASVTIADAGSYYATDNVEAALQEVGHVTGDNLILATAALPTTDAGLFEGLKIYDITADQQLWCKVPGEQEVNTLTVTGAPTKAGLNDITIALHGVDVAVEVDGGTRDVHLATITAGATGDGNITFTLDSAAKVIGVLTGDSASDVAGKVTAALAADADWTVGNVGADITFTAKVSEVKSGTFTFEDTGTTGVTCTGGVTSSVVGVAGDDIDATATKIKQETYTGWTTSGTVPTVIFTKDTVGAGSAATFTDTDSTGVTIDGAAITQTNVGVTTVWTKGPTQWTTWSPTVTWTTHDPASPNTIARYMTNGNTVFFALNINSTDGNDATNVTVSLPIAPKNNGMNIPIQAVQGIGTVHTGVAAYIDDSTSNLTCRAAGAMAVSTWTDGSAVHFDAQGFYEIA